jgi:hypothetical protein
MTAPRIALIVTALFVCQIARSQDLTYTIVDTGQDVAYDDTQAVSPPAAGEAFFGQDAHYTTNAPSYQDNGDGTISDLNTGLMWQKTPDFDDKLTWDAAIMHGDDLVLAGHDDWRLPTIKELYSLIQFIGGSGATAAESTPYLDTTFFDFEYPDTNSGERVIDAQYWSSTLYVGTTMGGNVTAFGVNFADGRIKGYPVETGPRGQPKTCYVRYVRGARTYGVNEFTASDEGTVTDAATGLMWSKADSGRVMDWEAGLAYAEASELAGHTDWRLPNAKELQSIVDYTHAPDATDAADQGPAIDTTVFEITDDESYFWTGTTLAEGPGQGVYIAFGRAMGYWGDPRSGETKEWMDVHGAGAQRGDPKSGDPAEYPEGRGPQGDDVRINNYVRLVRNVNPDEVMLTTPREPTEADNRRHSPASVPGQTPDGDPSQPGDDGPPSDRPQPGEGDDERRPPMDRPPRPADHEGDDEDRLPPPRRPRPVGHDDDSHRPVPDGAELDKRPRPIQ